MQGQTITAPSGRQYAWNKPTPPTQEDWAALHLSQGPATQPAQTQTEQPSMISQAADVFGRYAKQTAKSVAHPFLHPIDTMISLGKLPVDLLQNQGAEWEQAKAAYDKGDKGKAALHMLAYLTPVIGPMVDSAAQRTAQGQGPEVAGDLTAMFLPGAVASRLPALAAIKKPLAATTPEQKAVQFGLDNGVTPDLGNAIGGGAGSFVRGVDKAAQKMTLAGAYKGGELEAERAGRMATLGEQLAAKANSGGASVSIPEAGERLRSAGVQSAAKQNAAANTLYSSLRKLEDADPAKYAVDVSAAQKALRPVYEDMLRKAKEMNIQYQGPERRMFEALDDLMRAGNTASLSAADKSLSVLKSLQRGNPDKFGDAGSLIGQTVDALSGQVEAAAKGAGGPAWDMLQAGRRATVKKYDALDFVDKLREEPVGTINALKAQHDGGIGLLRDVQRVAPEELQHVGRAVLDDITAVMRGNAEGKDLSVSAWNKIGPETKKLIFADALKKDPTYLSQLDRFFKLHDMLKANPNPSGSAYIGGAAMHLGSMAGGWQGILEGIAAEGGGYLATALSSPRVVRALTRGMSVPVKSPAAAASTTSEIVSALKAAGLPVPAALTADKEKEPK